jgi:hypothetical protein
LADGLPSPVLGRGAGGGLMQRLCNSGQFCCALGFLSPYERLPVFAPKGRQQISPGQRPGIGFGNNPPALKGRNNRVRVRLWCPFRANTLCSRHFLRPLRGEDRATKQNEPINFNLPKLCGFHQARPGVRAFDFADDHEYVVPGEAPGLRRG